MSERRHKPGRSRRGAALVAVLWVGLLAGALLLTVQQTAKLELRQGHGELARTQARWLARAGVEQAMAVLADDDPGDDSELDDWYADEASFEAVELATGSFSVRTPGEQGEPRWGLIDLAGRVNINAADEEQLAKVGELTPQQTAAILDWRDDDEQVRPGGAERGYYQRQPFPYEIRNDKLKTRAELRLVRGIDERTWSGERTEEGSPFADFAKPGLAELVTVRAYELNQDASGRERINISEANEDELRQSLSLSRGLARGIVSERDDSEFESLMDLLDVEPESEEGDDEEEEGVTSEITLKWLADNLDRLTLSDEERIYGRINLNTASSEVLETLPEVGPAEAEAIIAHRGSSSGPLRSVGELLGVRGIEEDVFKAVAERVSVRSSVFEVTSVGTAPTGARTTLTAIVDRASEPAAIVYWQEGY
ncbi:MAG: helix-hairpin-helix domain-containing protein [Phycisphaeraceae bacterium]